MINVFWLSYNKETPCRGYWDMSLLEDLFANRNGKPVRGYNFKHNEVRSLEGFDGGVVVFPARAQINHVERLNKELKAFKWAILMIVGDEEASMPIEKIKHPNISIWVMSPRPGKHDEYVKIPNGYTPHSKLASFTDKTKNYFFAGQVTHDRRRQCVDALKGIPGGEVYQSLGFTQGLEPGEYMEKLSNARICPCPSGPETPDTFRIYEALEAGCIPIVDEQTPKGDFEPGYFGYLFGATSPMAVTDITNPFTDEDVSPPIRSTLCFSQAK